MTPKTIDADVLKLIKLVNKKTEPIFISVIPEKHALPSECFPTVKEKIKINGGKMIIGWQVWKTDFLVEAEFHAIWESTDGSLVDITPKQVPVDKILFLPDDESKYTGKQVDNIRLNITKNPLVDDFIELAKLKFRITNCGKLANQLGAVKFTGKDSQMLQALLAIKNGVYGMILNDCTKNSLCFCGRNKKYKHCHGKDLRKAIKRLYRDRDTPHRAPLPGE